MAPTIPGNARVDINFDAWYGQPESKTPRYQKHTYSNELDYSQTQDKEAFRQWYNDTVDKGWTKFDWGDLEHRPWTLNDDFEKVWAQVNKQGTDWANGIVEGQAGEAARAALAKALLDGGGSGGSGSSGSQAAMIRSLVNSIEEGFNRQRGALDTNKATSTANIQKNYDAFKQGVANNQALYQQGSAAIQAEITRRMAESAARNAETSGQVAAAVGGIGGSASAASAQAAANQASLAASQGFQQDMANRTDQIVGANQRAAENSGELVRQGASGNLETTYNAMLNALLAQREQNLLQAQMGAMSSGGGGGGGSKPKSISDVNKELRASDELDAWIKGDMGGLNSFFGSNASSAAQSNGATFLAMVNGDEEQQRQAQILFPQAYAEYVRASR